LRSCRRDQTSSIGQTKPHSRCVSFVLVTLMLFSVGVAAASSRPSNDALAAITARGVLLAGYDAAAWQSTDAVTATHPSKGLIERYMARKTDAGWVVDFGRLNGSGDRFLAAYEAVQTGSPARYEVKTFTPVREDVGWNLSAAKAVELVTKDFGPTTRPYNIAVLPGDAGSLYVYLYPAQVKAGVYPLGGDVRYRVSPDGSSITEKLQMHKSIIESVSADPKVKVESGYHTHVLSDVPEDTDVLLVLTRQPKVPEMVVTQTFMYTIATDGTITVADRPK
jgi:hypothetical protein